jgi:NADH-quinone oxidoreductase subunit E
MPHLILELALWMLLAFFIGCIIGCILRRLFTSGESAALRDIPPQSKAASSPSPEAAAEPGPPIPEQTQAVRPERPKGLVAARNGKSDNLQRIAGIGPKHERTLLNLGFFHFDQIAAWTEGEIAWVDDHLRFEGCITREEWIAQARLLAEGKEEEFEQRYGPGRQRRA